MENGGNPTLETLELAAAGLNMAVMLIPNERLRDVRELLTRPRGGKAPVDPLSLMTEDPWKYLLRSADDD